MRTTGWGETPGWRHRSRLGAIGLLSTAALLLVASPAHADRPFEPPARFTANQPGDITAIGNTVLTCPQAAANCVNARAGTASAANSDNNDFNMTFVDVDSDAGTDNSSRATLAMPSNATVLWAGLYWFGRTSDSDRDTVKFQAPGQTGYTTLTADVLDTGASNAYQGFVPVTTAVAAAGNGAYTVADVVTNTGTSQHGGWALIVAYGDATQPPRNLSVFDGLVTIPPAQTITVTGFTTPPSGAVDATLGVVASEGDLGLSGDSMSLNNTVMSNSANPATNNFNSSISTLGTDVGGRTPNYKNQLGVDIDLYDVPAGVIGNLDTSATIKLTTNSDQYLPGVVTFTAELYAPVVVPDKQVQNVSNPGGPARPGDRLRYSLDFENTGQDAAAGFTVTDPIPGGATYAPNSLAITQGPNAPATPSDAGDGDLGEFDGGANEVRFRLGTGANGTTGGTLAQGQTVAVTFDVIVDSNHKDGDLIVNRGSSDYRGATLGTPFLDQLTPEVTTPVRVPDLTLAKSHTPPFVSGDDTTFTLIASNVGTVPTTGTQVTVTDTFPGGAAGFDSISNAEGAGWSCQIAGLALTCTRGDVLPNGQSYPPIFVDARVHDPIAATIVNTASISGGGDGNPNNNVAIDSGGAGTQADVQLTKRTTTPQVVSGGAIEWVLEVRNAGPSTATNVTVDDALAPADYGNVVATPSQGSCTAAVACTLGNMVPGGTATIRITATALGNDETLDNTASTTSDTDDPVLDNNNDEATVIVANTADVSVTKTGGPANPTVGDPYTYELTIENNGPGTATNLELTDQLTATLGGPITVNPGGWTCNSPGGGGLLECARGSLNNGDSSTIEVIGTITAGGLFTNSAGVKTGSEDPNKGNNTATTTDNAAPGADVAVIKSFDTDLGTGGIQNTPVNTNATVEVVLTVTNNGPSQADNVILTDVFPAELEVTAVPAGCTESPADTVTCDFGDMADGANETRTITAQVRAGVQNVTFPNTASVATDTDDDIPSNDTSTDRLTVVPAADLMIAKSADPATAGVGDLVEYSLVVTNNGPSDATGVSVEDEIPAGMTFENASAGCGAPVGGTITCAPPGGTLASGDSVTFTINVRPTPGSAGQGVVNAATVTSNDPHDPDPTNNRSTTTVQVQPRADLAIVKTADDPTPAIDADNTYRLEVTNNGPSAAENVVIDDPVPAGMTFVSASQGCNLIGTSVHCEIGTLGSGDNVTLTITLRAGPSLHGQNIVNTASVGSTTPDPVQGNNQDDAAVTVGERVDLAVTKTVNPSSITAGQTATYDLTVTNSGPSDATGVTLTDPLQSGLEFVGASSSQGNCSFAAGTVTCNLGTIAPGDLVTVQITVRALDSAVGQPLNNTAGVSANEPEARTNNNVASTGLGVSAAPAADPGRAKLSLRKKASRGLASAGDTVTFTVTVRSLGPDPARNVTLCDPLPSGLLFVSAAGATFKNGKVCWKFTELAVGAVRKLKLTVRVAKLAADRRVTNIASVKASNAKKRKASAALGVRAAPGRGGGVTG